MNTDTIRAIAYPAAAFLVGATAGYLVAKRKYLAFADEEIENYKTQYDRVNKRGVFSTPTSAAAELIPSVDEVDEVTQKDLDELRERLRSHDYVKQESEPETVNVFDEYEDPRPRMPDKPYMITFEEYNEGKEGFEQVGVTYYEADDTLCDDREVLVDDVEGTVGQANLDAFWSDQARRMAKGDEFMYVRNEKSMTDFEISRVSGSYSVLVAGMDPVDLEPEPRPKVRKMRDVRDS